MRTRLLPLTFVAALLLVTPRARADQTNGGKSPDRAPSDVASAWFEELYDVVKAESTAPPSASRIYGITAVALYESIVAATRENRSLVGQLTDLAALPQPNKRRTYHWPAVANIVLANTIRGLYPTISQASLDAIDSLEESIAAEQRDHVRPAVYERSVAHGQAVAATILEWAATDGFSSYNNCAYVPAPVAGAWKPTPPAFNPNPLQPCWGFLRPMVLTQGECAPAPHPAFSTDSASDFYAAGLEVHDVVLGLTDSQKTIATYWADGSGATGTPAGHWIAIVSQIARNDELSLAEAAEAYARVGIAVHDAFIACWSAKYTFNLQRPVTFINDNIDSGWLPFLLTPPFPGYASGHSTQSGAAARVLTDMFGTLSFTDTTHDDHGLVPPQEPRTFASFEEAAAEAAVSRLYGGIHFSFDNAGGLEAGQCAGQAIQDRVRFKRRHRDR